MNSGTHLIYSVDASAVIGLAQDYPPDVFPGVWDCVDTLAEADRLAMIEDAANECKDPESQAWVSRHASIVVPLTVDVQTCVSRVQIDLSALGQYLVRTGSTKDRADPFVLGLAMAENTLRTGGPSTGAAAVWSNEIANNITGPGRVRLPDACRRYGVECMRTVEVLRREGWTFVLE